jgi:drug/metabolite transporter (DMT)-like permease
MPELAKLSSHSISALLYLIVIGSIGMIAYFYLIKHEPLSRVSTYCFVNAIGAVILGVFIGKEELSKNFFIAFSFVLVSIVLMLRAMVKEDKKEILSDNL